MGKVRYSIARDVFGALSAPFKNGVEHRKGKLASQIYRCTLTSFSVVLVLLVSAICSQAQVPIMIVGQPSVTPLSDQGITTNVNVLQTTGYTVITLSMTASRPVANLVTIATIPFHVSTGFDERLLIATTVTHSGAISTNLPGRSVYATSYSPYNFTAPVTSDGSIENIEEISFDLDPLLGISTATATVTVTLMIGNYAGPVVEPGNGKVDFDGDGKTDVSFWSAPNGTWSWGPQLKSRVSDVPAMGDMGRHSRAW